MLPKLVIAKFINWFQSRSRACCRGGMVKVSGQMGPSNWVPDKWISYKWVPDKRVPNKRVPANGFWTNGSQTNGSRTNRSRINWSWSNESQTNSSRANGFRTNGTRTNGCETSGSWSILSQDLDCYSTGMSTTKMYVGSLITNKYAEKSDYIFVNRAIKF